LESHVHCGVRRGAHFPRPYHKAMVGRPSQSMTSRVAKSASCFWIVHAALVEFNDLLRQDLRDWIIAVDKSKFLQGRLAGRN
jgi:hypothetical protein